MLSPYHSAISLNYEFISHGQTEELASFRVFMQARRYEVGLYMNCGRGGSEYPGARGYIRRGICGQSRTTLVIRN
jgi:hypothetical protein